MPRRSHRRPRITPVRALVAALALIVGVLFVRSFLFPHPPEHQTPYPRPSATATSSPTPAVVASPTPSKTPVPHRSPVAATTSSPVPAGRARLALIVDDCGQWLHIEEGYISLPIPLTLAVLPELRYSTRIADEAHAAGKGVMLHLPMQPIAALNPGPGKIMVSMNDETIEAQVARDIDAVPYAEGANNHEGSRATSDPRVMAAVMRVFRRRGLFFIDSRTIATTVAQRTARAYGVPNAARDVFLDDRNTLPAVEAQLRLAARIALAHGSAIAIGHPRPATLAAVRALYPELQREGITFVLARTLVSIDGKPSRPSRT
ncbi:MAG: divergent polysaccharide deacetylase family protein [Candidatus Eremiobacteraeota bacterium]|uniref:Divergent polysaccharide deacetylase n=1 Tax=mine drainage metagenome TaxID=410659 RepID=E6PE47_9ZZZZ|nr:divergent polysaccharide deacetylase family protein [Candidatus Eremiobacteraeota bacterium]